MAKFKEPIIIKLETIENAVVLFEMLETTDVPSHPNARVQEISMSPEWVEGECYKQIVAEFAKRGIDPSTWKPEPPVMVGDHPVRFNEDESIQVGCTHVPFEKLKEVIDKASALKYPKFYLDDDGDILVARSKEDLGVWFRRNGETMVSYWKPAAQKHAEEVDYKQVTQKEAEEHLGRAIDLSSLK